MSEQNTNKRGGNAKFGHISHLWVSSQLHILVSYPWSQNIPATISWSADITEKIYNVRFHILSGRQDDKVEIEQLLFCAIELIELSFNMFMRLTVNRFEALVRD